MKKTPSYITMAHGNVRISTVKLTKATMKELVCSVIHKKKKTNEAATQGKSSIRAMSKALSSKTLEYMRTLRP